MIADLDNARRVIYENLLQSDDLKNLDLSIDSKSFHPCPNCPKIYRGKYTLSRHLRLECGKVPSHKCQVCGQLFAHKHRLLSHVKSIHAEALLENTTPSVSGGC